MIMILKKLFFGLMTIAFILCMGGVFILFLDAFAGQFGECLAWMVRGVLVLLFAYFVGHKMEEML